MGLSSTPCYRLGMVNSKSFFGKILLRIKQIFELLSPIITLFVVCTLKGMCQYILFDVEGFEID